MAYLVTNIPPTEVLIRKEYLYHNETGFETGVAFAVKSMQGHAAYFQVMTELGAVYDKLPISALSWKEDAPHMRYDILQLWDCFSYNLTCIQYSYLKNKRVQLMLKDKQLYEGRYLFSLDWAGNSSGELDASFAEAPGQHKQGHFIALENGNFALQPNNRMLWNDPALVSKPFETIPRYKLATEVYSCEYKEKWATNSENYFYDISSDIKTEDL
jgi:hypothetical protein